MTHLQVTTIEQSSSTNAPRYIKASAGFTLGLLMTLTIFHLVGIITTPSSSDNTLVEAPLLLKENDDSLTPKDMGNKTKSVVNLPLSPPQAKNAVAFRQITYNAEDVMPSDVYENLIFEANPLFEDWMKRQYQQQIEPYFGVDFDPNTGF